MEGACLSDILLILIFTSSERFAILLLTTIFARAFLSSISNVVSSVGTTGPLLPVIIIAPLPEIIWEISFALSLSCSKSAIFSSGMEAPAFARR